MTNMTKMPDKVYVSEYDTCLNFLTEDDANTIAGKGVNTEYVRSDLIPQPVTDEARAKALDEVPTLGTILGDTQFQHASTIAKAKAVQDV